MKRIVILMLLVATLTGCKEKKKPDVIIAPRIEKSQPKAPVRMQESHDMRAFEWLGRKYNCIIDRVPADSLPMVKDENGQKFVDNIISLKITREDGSVFFNKKFTKDTFDGYIDGDYRRTGILEGLVFDEIDDDRVELAASISHPQTDEYIPLVVSIDRYGGIIIKKDTDLDGGVGESSDDLDDEDGV